MSTPERWKEAALYIPPYDDEAIAGLCRMLGEAATSHEALARENAELRKAASRLAAQASPRLDGMGNTVWAVLDDDLKRLETALSRTGAARTTGGGDDGME